jgi:hypothetical protein
MTAFLPQPPISAGAFGYPAPGYATIAHFNLPFWSELFQRESTSLTEAVMLDVLFGDPFRREETTRVQVP